MNYVIFTMYDVRTEAAAETYSVKIDVCQNNCSTFSSANSLMRLFQKQMFRRSILVNLQALAYCITFLKVKLLDRRILNIFVKRLFCRAPLSGHFRFYPSGANLLKVNNKRKRRWCDRFLKLIIRTPEQSHWRWSNIFIENFEQISHLTLNM